MPPFRALAAAAAAGVLFLLAGCTIAEEATTRRAAAVSVQPPCEETRPTPGAQRPPVLADRTSAWYGQGDLWVQLPDYAPEQHGDALMLKFPMVTLEDGVPTVARGAPVVSATSSDADGMTPGVVNFYTQTYGTGNLAFWPVSVAFPAPGCWTVTGRLGESTVLFTVDVEPA
jgi:hypothetical protein